MTRARRDVVLLDDTPYKHCISRCVRCAFLCVFDKYAGEDDSHRPECVGSRRIGTTNAFAEQIGSGPVLEPKGC